MGEDRQEQKAKNVMTKKILEGDPPIEVTLRRSARARRLSLRVSRLDGRVTLSMPKRVAEAEAMSFLVEKQHWIRGHLAKRAPEVRRAFGVEIPFCGEDRLIVPGQGRSARFDGAQITVPGPAGRVPVRLKTFFRFEAQNRLRAASDHYAAALGVGYSRISLRDTRSRWGSCSSAGGLMYSWRLVMAPVAVQNYVAAHEVAHLREMNHSPAFWSLVADLCPDYEVHRRWLRQNGEALHAWRFDGD